MVGLVVVMSLGVVVVGVVVEERTIRGAVSARKQNLATACNCIIFGSDFEFSFTIFEIAVSIFQFFN